MIKFQGSMKGLVLVAVATIASMASVAAHAQRVVPTAGGRGGTVQPRPPVRVTPPPPVVVVPPCKRGGPGITPC